MATSSVESEIFGIVLESIPTGTNSTITGVMWECLGGSRPRFLTRRFNAVCYYLPSAPALPADSIRKPSSGTTVSNQEVKIHFLSGPAHTYSYQLDMEIFCDFFFPGYFSAASKCHSITQSGCTRIQSWPYYNLI